MAVCTIIYIYGPKSYSFLRQFFPLPHESTLRRWFSPDIHLYMEKLTNIESIPEILPLFMPASHEGSVHATLAIDAAKYKDATGAEIKKEFPSLQNVQDDVIYTNIFVFYLQPINYPVKPFPVHVLLAQNGSANDNVLSITQEIIQILGVNNIITDFIATDGDHKYDKIHEDFLRLF